MRGFKEVGWVIAIASTTLGCYMVNLRVASERATLEEVSNNIVLAQRDIRVLQTEIGTRGRLEQLESWNVRVLALSAPQAHQFLEGGYQLATLTAPKRTVDPAAPVVLASAPAPKPQMDERKEEGTSARDMMYVASYKRQAPETAPEKTVVKREPTVDEPVKAAAKPAKSAASASNKDATGAKAAAPAKEASAKPKPKPKPASPATSKTTKDVQAQR
jgi:hypothetical protein